MRRSTDCQSETTARGPRPGRIVLTLLATCVAAALSQLDLAQDAGPEEPTIEPIDIGFVERTGRSLLFIDIEAVDKKDNPLTGLKKEDFKIRVNYVWRKIYSVDDLCPCGDAAPDPNNPPQDPVEATRLALVRTPPHYVFYFDFSQLRPVGRAQAVLEAKRWVQEQKRPDDRVMVVAYATEAGLRRLTDFTSDSDRILQAIDEGANASDMLDPFPAGLNGRVANCVDGTLGCYHMGRVEQRHAERSMTTLRNFLTELDEVPQRKSVVLFHENQTIFPGRVYGGAPGYIPETIQEEIRGHETIWFERVARMRSRTELVPDLLELEEELGGTATASRAVVYPILCGSARPWSVNFGANLADQTGGAYNRRLEDLREVLDEAGRRCPCIYRIGLELGKERSFVLRTKIRVGGMTLPSRYRVQYLTDADRWMRKAQLVMANPSQWLDLDVQSAVVPLAASEKTWDVAVQVAFDLASLGGTIDDDNLGEWEVAALLGRDEFRKNWEMLGAYRASRDGIGRPRGMVLHEQVLEGLKPGRYELRAFVRDRATNRLGGTRIQIELPEPAKGGLAGPVALRPNEWRIPNRLPLRKKKKPDAVMQAKFELGPLPLGSPGTVQSGQSLQFLTWSCAVDPTLARSAVSGGAGERWTSKPADLRSSGNCTELSDIVDTGLLPPGLYGYEVSDGGEAPVSASSPFLITASPDHER